MTGTVDPSKLGTNPNEPRQIRARTGMTNDPLPAGKKLEEKEFPNITPAKHDQPDAIELSKDDIKAHKEELKHMQDKDQKHGGQSNSLGKADTVNSSAQIKAGREPRNQH